VQADGVEPADELNGNLSLTLSGVSHMLSGLSLPAGNGTPTWPQWRLPCPPADSAAPVVVNLGGL
jgi:hypothetical protein